MNDSVLVAGGGIGGLACALALARAQVPVTLLEQAQAFGEVGAGLQLGPNAVRVLDEWGLSPALHAVAAFPEEIRARDAHSAGRLGRLRLGPVVRARYGMPYATVHRADLHGLLLEAVRLQPMVTLHLGERVASYEARPDGVQVVLESGRSLGGAALVGCDGLWSRVRSQMLGATPVRSSGHLAYRGMVSTKAVPAGLADPVVTVWLGPRLHVVHYPVRSGTCFNVVAVVEGVLGQGHGGEVGADPQSWSHEAHAHDLRRALGPACGDLVRMIEAVPDWKLWPLNDRPPVSGAHEHAQGRVALLGDAAHPLRPYLAQGAAMAIEDAWTMGRLADAAADPGRRAVDWIRVFAAFAEARWERNARVQSQSARNGTIFHADGLLRQGRNAAMALLGERLMDNPWLYSGPPRPNDLAP
ncbi:MAG: FAD-dependent monooxygenase [Burkholderiaceae bacterium]